MSEQTDQQLNSWDCISNGLETLRGKNVAIAALQAPPAQVMACYCFRAWETSDSALYRRLLDDPELWRFMYEEYPGKITEDMANALIEVSRHASHHKVRAVEYQGKVIGQARMQWQTDITPPQSGEISYWLAREYWGLGLAAPIIALFSWRCLSIFPALKEISARVHRDNFTSERALQRLGWSQSGADGDWRLFRMQRSDGLDWSRLNRPRALPQ